MIFHFPNTAIAIETQSSLLAESKAGEGHARLSRGGHRKTQYIHACRDHLSRKDSVTGLRPGHIAAEIHPSVEPTGGAGPDFQVRDRTGNERGDKAHAIFIVTTASNVVAVGRSVGLSISLSVFKAAQVKALQDAMARPVSRERCGKAASFQFRSIAEIEQVRLDAHAVIFDFTVWGWACEGKLRLMTQAEAGESRALLGRGGHEKTQSVRSRGQGKVGENLFAAISPGA